MLKEFVNNYVEKLSNLYGCSKWRATSMKYGKKKLAWLEFQGAACPICGRDHYCVVSPDNKYIQCSSIVDERSAQAINDNPQINWKFKHWIYPKNTNNEAIESDTPRGSWWINTSKNNVLSKEYFKNAQSMKLGNTIPLAKPVVTDLMNRFVLHAFPLSEEHRANLHKRGLTDEDIKAMSPLRGFGSIVDDRHFKDFKMVYPNGVPKVEYSYWLNALKKNHLPLNLWRGVPGFFEVARTIDNKTASVPHFNAYPQGMLVPFVNEDGYIIGFQVRVDHPMIDAKMIKKLPDTYGKVIVKIDNKTETYTAEYSYPNGKKNIVVDTDKVTFKEQPIDLSKVDIDYKPTFIGKLRNKYPWITSSSYDGYRHGKLGINGTDWTNKLPVEVAYRPEIAVLEAGSDELKRYKQTPKAVWLTEGGLKAIITAHLLPKYFKKDTLDKVGHDVIGVPGSDQYSKFIPVLKNMHVTSATIAYDMDMLTNPRVKEDMLNLLNALIQNNIKPRLALWNLNDGKGIDDILTSSNCFIKFKEINVDQYKK